MIHRAVAAILLLLSPRAVLSAQGKPAPTKVLGAQGSWWILDDRGTLKSLDGQRVPPKSLNGRVLDLARTPQGKLLVLAAMRDHAQAQIMEYSSSGGWKTYASLPIASSDTILALAASDTDAIVLAGRALYHVRAGQRAARVPIKGPAARGGLQPALARTPSGQLYVGKNLGEFGGSLVHIDPVTGTSESIEQRGPQACDGPLNPDCDPITAVIPDDTHPDCVIASIGLRHMVMETGRVLRVCGATVRVIAELPYPKRNRDDMATSIAVFGLAPDSTGFWAATALGLYHFRDDTVDQRRPLPKLQRGQSFSYSTAISGLLVLSTDINWRASVSGPTPLIAARGAPR